MPPSRGRPNASGCFGIRLSGWRPGPFSRVSVARRCRSRAAPNLPRHLDDAGKLRPFALLRDRDVLGGAGRKPALRAQAQLLELDIAACLLDPPFEHIDALQFGDLGGDEAEHHEFSLPRPSQRWEWARSRIVGFAEKALPLHGA